MSDIEDRVRTIIAEQQRATKGDVTLTVDLVNDLGADSLDTAELIMALETEFGITFKDEDEDELAGKLKTVGDVVNLIKSKVS